MKRNTFSITVVITILGIMPLFVNAQNVQSYQTERVYETRFGSVPGKEKYSYSVNEDGDKLLQGNYIFSGVHEFGNNTAQIKNTVSVTTTCKDNKINGSYVLKENVVGKKYIPFQGWKTATASVNFSGTFTNGNPNGNFSIIINDDGIIKGSATLKNGKYIGFYNYEMPGYKLSGNLTTDGKLSGEWIDKDPQQTIKYVFENDVLINTIYPDRTTSPALQQVAKQYATGKVTKQQLIEMGYGVKIERLPLDNLIDELFLGDETGLKRRGELNFHGEYNFSEYGEKTYSSIEKVNFVTNEMFNRIENNIKTAYHGHVEGFMKSLDERKKDFGYEIYSDGGGSYYESAFYLNNSQYEKLWDTYLGRIIQESSKDFADELYNDRADRNRNIGNFNFFNEIKGLYVSYRENPQRPFEKLFTIDTTYLKEIYEKNQMVYKNFKYEISRGIQNNTKKTTSDSTYVIECYVAYPYAYKLEYDIWNGFDNALLDAFNKAVVIVQNVKAFSLLTPKTKLHKYIIRHGLNGITYDSQKQIYKSKNSLSQTYERVQETSQLLEQLEAIESNHSYIVSNIEKKKTKDYQNTYKKLSLIKPSGDDINIEQCKSIFSEILNQQKDFLN